MVLPAFRELRGTPYILTEALNSIPAALIGEVVEEDVELPVFTLEAGNSTSSSTTSPMSAGIISLEPPVSIYGVPRGSHGFPWFVLEARLFCL